jgi:hypothetical protein
MFPQITRLAIRQHLAETGAGAEIVLSLTDDRPTLRPASRVTIADLELSVRSNNCLKAASIETLDELLVWKPAQLMELPNFGRKCLNEITNVVQQLGYSSLGGEVVPRNLPLPGNCAPLACLLDVRDLVPKGSLPELFAAHGWYSLSDLTVHSVNSLVGLAGVPTEERLQLERALSALSIEVPLDLPAWFLHNTDVLRKAFHADLEQLKCLLSDGKSEISSLPAPPLSGSLNEELSKLIPKSYDDRNRRIVSDLLGLGGKDPLTLDEVAKAQTPCLTRERVRQVAKPITNALKKRGHKLPCLLKAVATLKLHAPCSLMQAEQALLDEKIVDAPITVAAILRLARRSHIGHELFLERGTLLTTDMAGLVNAVMSAAGRLSSHWGVVDWREIEPLVPEAIVSAVKAQLHELVWLDGEQRYFVLPRWENSLANRLARILAVTPRLKLADAYQGAFRDVRMEKERLPETLFAAFCGVWPWCTVEGDEISAREGLPPSEVSGDDLLVLLLREIGYPVRRRELTKRAVEQGLSLETVVSALSYSNVIASANGYFAVIGDPRLEEFGKGVASVPPQVLELATEPEDGGLVPDASVGGFVGPLMLAVQERVTTLGLTPPWSASELRLSHRDRDLLLAWGRSAQWDFRADFQNFETKSSEKVRERTALGLVFLLFASEAVRRFGGSGSIWPAIEEALGETQQRLFLHSAGVPRLALREAVEAACRTFGLRHGFEDVSQQVWVRTVEMQTGLQCSQLPGLAAMLAEPAYLQPAAIHLLLDQGGPNSSASFRASWNLLKDVSQGTVSERDGLERFGADAWLSPFPAEQLLAQCLIARHWRTYDAAEPETIAKEEAYQYFLEPVLRWASDDAYLEYDLNKLAPPWHESATLIFFCDDPFRKERVPIENDRWQLPGGPLRVPLANRAEAGFRFKLLQGKEEVFAGWMYAGLPREAPFTFFRATGATVRSADDVPQSEEVVLLHSADVQVKGLNASPIFRAVLCGTYRLTRLPAGAVTRVQLVDPDGQTLWSLPTAEEIVVGKPEPVFAIRAGRWGTVVDATLPDLSFTAERLKLNSGQVVPIVRGNGYAVIQMSPGVTRAQVAQLQGSAGGHRRSTRVKLRHLGSDFGAALEADGNWQPLDGSTTLDAATLRTQRMLAKVKGPLGTDQDVCWMEGNRTLAGLRNQGMSLIGVHGLGESLNVVRGTYNSSQTEIPVASAVTDGGFWRSVQREADESWSAHLPFEGPLEDGHALWMWTEGSPLPRELPREQMLKTGFSLRWRCVASTPVLGWAFSFDGARVGSVIQPERLGVVIQRLSDVQWIETAIWLRWWHAPVLHREMRNAMADRVREHPVETLKAWLLPAPVSSGLIFDELREEAWAAAAREFLWGWRPNPNQAVELVKASGIWTGDIERDSQQPPSLEAVGLLARTSPVLLADATTQALPTMYSYPKPQLAVLLGRVLEAINPNAAEKGFRLELSCERYAKGESRLDGRFILTSLIGAARAIVRGDSQDTHNLRIAFHQAGLRELISTALLRDAFDRWQGGTED